ncbi:MAG: SH3 domain-containing protein, partial [Rhodospirillaceae bacterium]|nr:SH3 domain-containing protein [Rhodospirillaceae bacterium]
GTQYPINWIYKRRGMPMEVIRDLDNWRRVRDRWGTVGWIHVSNLSGKRTALIDRQTRTLRRKPADATPVARAQAGVIAKIRKCVKAWCRVSAAGKTAWVRRTSIWGVYKTEEID